jgi:hypothetical protein
MLPAEDPADAPPTGGISIASPVAAPVVAEPVARGAAVRLADGRWPAEVAAPGDTPALLRDTVR